MLVCVLVLFSVLVFCLMCVLFQFGKNNLFIVDSYPKVNFLFLNLVKFWLVHFTLFYGRRIFGMTETGEHTNRIVGT